MKYFLPFLVANFFFTSLLLSQNNRHTTVVIIGVSHTESRFMNTDSLLLVLQKVKPDLILDEMQSPSGYYTNEKELRELPSSLQLRTQLGIGKKPPPERMVLYEYRKIDPNIIIRPFDIYIEDRNKYIRQDSEWEKRFFSIVNDPKYSSTFSSYQTDLFLQYIRLNKFLYEITRKSYFDMNQPHVPDSLRKMTAISDPFIMSILDSVPSAGTLKQFYEKNKSFWRERNEKMASNIIEYIQEYPGKRIVVLTGLLHKHYLMDLLHQSPLSDLFKVVEFYDPELARNIKHE
jgi:hypothetical protein